MKASNFKSEAELQKLLWTAIEEDRLTGCITDHCGLTKDDDDKAQSSTSFPQFSIDHHVRRSCLRAGSRVLSALGMLVPLTSDKNVSFASAETMRPDIVCINPEQQSLVLFELKKASQTGRQALTELLAYEHEIKNLLPFLSNYDVHFVLVSSEWSTLMDHAAASAVAWSGRNVLCLEAGLEDGLLALKTRIPPAWTITGSVYFPEQALPSVTLCLYEKDAYSEENRTKGQITKAEELDPRIWTAMEVIAREGDRMGGHGFALLWRDHWGVSLTSYNITVVGVAPFAFYQASREGGMIPDGASELVRKFDEYLTDYDPTGHADSLIAAAAAGNALLEEVSDPKLEGFSTWAADMGILRRRAEPLLCEFWGEPGAYARSYILNPAVRAHRRNTLRNGTGDWRDPSVGIPLIASFTRPEIFPDGDVRCSDAFRFGVLFGLDRVLRLTIRSGKQAKDIACQFEWNRFELMAATDEIRMLADAANNVEPPAEPFRFYEDPHVDDNTDSQRFVDWFVSSFLQHERIHTRLFEIGANGAVVFSFLRHRRLGDEIHESYYDKISEPVHAVTGELLQFYRRLAKEDSPPQSVHRAFGNLIRVLGLRKNFRRESFEKITAKSIIAVWDFVLDALNSVIPAVFHQHAAVAPANPDWAWLKQGVTEMRQRGIADAGVILLPNGQLVTGPVNPEDCKITLRMDAPDNEVPFLDRSNGFGFMMIMTWEALAAKFSGRDQEGVDPGTGQVKVSDDRF